MFQWLLFEMIPLSHLSLQSVPEKICESLCFGVAFSAINIVMWFYFLSRKVVAIDLTQSGKCALKYEGTCHVKYHDFSGHE